MGADPRDIATILLVSLISAAVPHGVSEQAKSDWSGMLRNTPYLTDHRTCHLPRRNHRALAVCLECCRSVAACRRPFRLASRPMMLWGGRPSSGSQGGGAEERSRVCHAIRVVLRLIDSVGLEDCACRPPAPQFGLRIIPPARGVSRTNTVPRAQSPRLCEVLFRTSLHACLQRLGQTAHPEVWGNYLRCVLILLTRPSRCERPSTGDRSYHPPVITVSSENEIGLDCPR